MSVTLVGTNGQVISTGNLASAVAGVNNVTVGSHSTAQIASVAVFFNGWWVNNNWTPPTSNSPATCVPMDAAGNVVSGSCSVTSINASDQYGSPGARYANVYVTVSSSAPRARVTFDFSKSPFPGWTPAGVTKANFEAAPETTCSTLPVLTLNTPTWNGTYYLQITQTSQGDVCPGP